MVTIVHCRKMSSQPHIKCRTNGAEMLHQCMIKAGKVFVIERPNYWVGDDNRAGNNRIRRRCPAFYQNFVEYAEVVLDKSVVFFEMRQHMAVANLLQR